MDPAPRISNPLSNSSPDLPAVRVEKAQGESGSGRAQGLVALKENFLHEESFCHPL